VSRRVVISAAGSSARRRRPSCGDRAQVSGTVLECGPEGRLLGSTSHAQTTAANSASSSDDKPAVRAALEAAGVEVSPGPRLNFRDPWGNHVQVVDYRDIRFTKASSVLPAMGLEELL
jgi:hypothetical protein